MQDIIALQMLNLALTLLQIMFVKKVTTVQWGVKLLQNVFQGHINHIRSRQLAYRVQRDTTVQTQLCKFQNNVKQENFVELDKLLVLVVLLALSPLS
jgi:hypothetical protein